MIRKELDRTVAPLFDNYKSLSDINGFLNENKKHPSTDKIYSLHENETEYETALQRFYYGLVSFLLYTKQTDKAVEILKNKYNALMSPVQVNRMKYDDDGNYLPYQTMEIV